MGFFDQALVTDTDYDAMRRGTAWLIGGPLPPMLVKQAHSNPGTLASVAFITASRACWRGDAFWDRYLRRFQTARIDRTKYTHWILDPRHEVLLLLRPKR
jgi:hypothetical protein